MKEAFREELYFPFEIGSLFSFFHVHVGLFVSRKKKYEEVKIGMIHNVITSELIAIKKCITIHSSMRID